MLFCFTLMTRISSFSEIQETYLLVYIFAVCLCQWVGKFQFNKSSPETGVPERVRLLQCAVLPRIQLFYERTTLLVTAEA